MKIEKIDVDRLKAFIGVLTKEQISFVVIIENQHSIIDGINELSERMDRIENKSYNPLSNEYHNREDRP